MQKKVDILNPRYKDANDHRTSCCYTISHKELNAVVAEQMQMAAEFWRHLHHQSNKLAYLQQSLFVFIIHFFAFFLPFVCQVEILMKTQKKLMFVIKPAIQLPRLLQTHSIVTESFNTEYPISRCKRQMFMDSSYRKV